MDVGAPPFRALNRHGADAEIDSPPGSSLCEEVAAADFFKFKPGLPVKLRNAKFSIGQVVRHRIYPFRGVVFDIDPEFSNTEDWWQSIPAEVRPRKDQPFYHLLAENEETEYVAYVSEQNLLPDTSGEPLRHPQISEMFEMRDGALTPRDKPLH